VFILNFFILSYFIRFMVHFCLSIRNQCQATKQNCQYVIQSIHFHLVWCVLLKWQVTGLRLPQAAFRDLVPGRSYHASTGVGTGTRAACGKSMLANVLIFPVPHTPFVCWSSLLPESREC